MDSPITNSPQQSEAEGKKPATRKFNHVYFLDIGSSTAIKLLSRLAVLTKNGTQPCIYTTKQIIKDFKCGKTAIFSALNKLESKGFIKRGLIATDKIGAVRSIELTTLAIERMEGKNLPSLPPKPIVGLEDSEFASAPELPSAESMSGSSAGVHSGSSAGYTGGIPLFSSQSCINMPFASIQKVPLDIDKEKEKEKERSLLYESFGSSLSQLGIGRDKEQTSEQATKSDWVKAAELSNGVSGGEWSTSGKEGLLRFDLSKPIKQLFPLSDDKQLIINGKLSDLRYDFTELKERVDWRREFNEPWVCAFNDGYKRTGIDASWLYRLAEFIVLDEIANYQDQLFTNAFFCSEGKLPRWDKINRSAIAEHYARCQFSILFKVLSSKWGYTYGPYEWRHSNENVVFASGKLEWVSQEFIEQVLRSYRPSDNANPERYISKWVCNEVMNILKEPDSYRPAIEDVIRELNLNVYYQRWDRDKNSPNWLDGYYPYTREQVWQMSIAGREQNLYASPFRLSYPYLLFRKIKTVSDQARYDKQDIELSDKEAIKILSQINQAEKTREQWKAFVALCGDDYPFLTKLECENA